jgi:hypothetical protein
VEDIKEYIKEWHTDQKSYKSEKVLSNDKDDKSDKNREIGI